MSASTACRCWARTAPSCAGWRIAAAPSITASGRSWAATCRSRWSSAPTRRPSCPPCCRCRKICRRSSSPGCCAASGRSLRRCVSVPLMVPADAEIVLEGFVSRHRDRARRPIRRPHRLLQLGRAVPGVPRHRHHHAARPDLSLHLHRPRRRTSRRGIGEALNDVFLPLVRRAVPRDRRPLAAAGGLLLPDRGGVDQEALSGPGAARDDGAVVDAAAVHLHQAADHRRRRHRRARLGRRDVGDLDPVRTRRAT